jgi:hypothetical protein
LWWHPADTILQSLWQEACLTDHKTTRPHGQSEITVGKPLGKDLLNKHSKNIERLEELGLGYWQSSIKFNRGFKIYSQLN